MMIAPMVVAAAVGILVALVILVPHLLFERWRSARLYRDERDRHDAERASHAITVRNMDARYSEMATVLTDLSQTVTALSQTVTSIQAFLESRVRRKS
ncbi:MAG: hypothetical protein ACR2RE_00710 [Geminicoccaceae bacterium]